MGAMEKLRGTRIVTILFLFAFLGVGYYWGWQARAPGAAAKPPVAPEAVAPSSSPERLHISGATDRETQLLIEKVWRHIYLPSGNVEVQTIVDAAKLRALNPVFYQFAKAGDKILFYQDRAVLYDPVVDQVLDVIHK